MRLSCVILFGIALLANSSSIPRSKSKPYSSVSSSPPWNPSSKIDPDGFLTENYTCLPGEWESETSLSSSRHARSRQIVQIRQVPGDGNCLFHSLSACLSFYENKTHADMRNTTLLRECSSRLRQAAVDRLSLRPRRGLFLQGGEYLRACDLVDAAAEQYNITGEEYCQLMRRNSYWGGGPEIVALCNVLRRPIYVYELNEKIDGEDTDIDQPLNTDFSLRRLACFGSPKFDRRQPLHILSADSRFPDISPGRQLDNGNHFLAIFPKKKLPRIIRAGAFTRKPPSSIVNREKIKHEKVSRPQAFNLLFLDYWMKQIGRFFGVKK